MSESDRAAPTPVSVPDSPASTTRSGNRLAWLDVLRAGAVSIVVWDHFVGSFLAHTGVTWLPNVVVNKVVFTPLAITQYGGFLGVSVFFLISGYIIARTARSESHRKFAIRRLLRIVPPLALASVIGFVLVKINPSISPGAADASLWDILTNISLTNYFLTPRIVLVGVAWSLVVEVVFYLLTFLFLPVLHSKRIIALFPFLIIAAALLLLATRRDFGPNYFLLVVNCLYMPLLAIGSGFYLKESRILNAWGFTAVLASGWLVFLWGTSRIYPKFLVATDSYPVSIAAALLIFTVLWLLRDRVTTWRPIKLLALSSYSIYLFHGIVGLPVLAHFYTSIGYTLALILALAATAGATVGSYLLVEKPCQRLARRLTRKQPVPVSVQASAPSA